MDLIACEHRDAEKTGKACEHLVAKTVAGENRSSLEHFRYFTGFGIECVFLCPQCGKLPDFGRFFWRTICDSCVDYIGCGKHVGDLGAPQISIRDTGLKLEHQVVSLITSNLRVVTVEPLVFSDTSSWIILTAANELMEFNAAEPSLRLVTTISELGLSTDQPISITVSKNGQFVAVTHAHGTDGVVFDRINRRVTMRLARGDYRTEHCHFSVAFFEFERKQLLIHATDWNRLDVSNPEDGTLITQRSPTSYKAGESIPAHYLDYFQCGLAVSPNGEWVADNGWVWQPAGIVIAWNLKRWLKDNVWEAEDGESMKSLCWRDYYWDGPMCWIDDHTVAIWGIGEDDLLMIPGVRLFDVVSGEEKKSFAGPTAKLGKIAFDRWLFSWQPDGPFSIWDISDGARLLIDPDFVTFGYHSGSKAFFSQLPDGTFCLSKVRENL